MTTKCSRICTQTRSRTLVSKCSQPAGWWCKTTPYSVQWCEFTTFTIQFWCKTTIHCRVVGVHHSCCQILVLMNHTLQDGGSSSLLPFNYGDGKSFSVDNGVSSPFLLFNFGGGEPFSRMVWDHHLSPSYWWWRTIQCRVVWVHHFHHVILVSENHTA